MCFVLDWIRSMSWLIAIFVLSLCYIVSLYALLLLFNLHIPASYRNLTHQKLKSDNVAPVLSVRNSTLEIILKNHISVPTENENTLIFWQENIFFGTLQFLKSQGEENHLKRLSEPPQWRIPLLTPKLFWLMTSSVTVLTLWSLEDSGSNERPGNKVTWSRVQPNNVDKFNKGHRNNVWDKNKVHWNKDEVIKYDTTCKAQCPECYCKSRGYKP